MSQPKPDKFESALEKLEGIIQKLESGDLPLDQSLKMFEEGVKLSRRCEEVLDEARKKVEILTKGDSPKDQKKMPFEVEE